MSCAVHAAGLRYAYPNGVLGLDGVDLHVTHGERVAILGPNGAGKTTLMLHLNALLVGSGELAVAGLRVGRDTVRDLRARVGLVFQDPDDQLFMPTVREDVAFGPLNLGCSRIEADARVAEALAAVRMEALADRAPADDRVLAHVLPLGGVERARGVQDRVGDRDLADVVQRGGAAGLEQIVVVEAEFARDGFDELGDVIDVVAQVAVSHRLIAPSGHGKIAAVPDVRTD